MKIFNARIFKNYRDALVIELVKPKLDDEGFLITGGLFSIPFLLWAMVPPRSSHIK